MDAAELRAAQAPLKDQYRSRPDTARTPLAADGRAASHGVTFAPDRRTPDADPTVTADLS